MTISACLIVKDEASSLTDCLESLQTAVDEIIIVDTGSQDLTKEIAKKYTKHLFETNWEEDFSAARNLSLKYASMEWILIVDADERLDTRSAQLLPDLLSNFDSKCPILLNAQVLTPGLQPIFTKALFPNHLGISFKGLVHEWPALDGHWLQGVLLI